MNIFFSKKKFEQAVEKQVSSKLSSYRLQNYNALSKAVSSMAAKENAFKPATKKELLVMYERQQWVYKAVSVIATSLAGLPVILRDINDPEKVLEGTEANDLVENPNFYQTWFEFIEELVAYFQLVGDSFTQIANKDGETNLINLRPDYMTAHFDPETLIGFYTWSPDEVKKRTFTPEEIMHIKSFAPRSQLYGLPAGCPSGEAMMLDGYATKYNKRFFKHGFGGRQYVKWEPKEQIADIEFERLEQQLKDGWSGIDNVHDGLKILENAEIKDTGVKPQDMALIEQKRSYRNEILSAYGVPLVAVQINDEESSTYNNTSEQMRGFWSMTMKNIRRRVTDSLNSDVFSDLGAIIEFDLRGVSALNLSEEETADILGVLHARGIITANEARKKVPLFDDLDAHPDGDRLVMRGPAPALSEQALEKAFPGALKKKENGIGFY